MLGALHSGSHRYHGDQMGGGAPIIALASGARFACPLQCTAIGFERLVGFVRSPLLNQERLVVVPFDHARPASCVTPAGPMRAAPRARNSNSLLGRPGPAVRVFDRPQAGDRRLRRRRRYRGGRRQAHADHSGSGGLRRPRRRRRHPANATLISDVELLGVKG
jgi:hypothetical protein